MFRDEAIEVAPTWAQDEQRDASYREVDKQLRRIAKKRAALDAEEAKWLREAERLRVWRKLGYSTALEYLEDVFGHTPRTAMERLRVAKELGELPGLEAELRTGALPWSAARELTRVMTPATEARWLDRARGKNVADIQALVSGHKKGDDPDSPKDPALMTRKLVLELPPALDALFERTRLMLEQERGEHLDDLAVFEAMCMCTLEPGSPAVTGKAPKPMHRIVTYKCEDCGRGCREGRGRLVPITPSDLELAACDAELVRALGPAQLPSDDGSAHAAAADDAATSVRRTKDGKVCTKRRPPPTTTIPKATRDFVWARDCGRCRVPSCRATRNVAAHHIRFRSQGGDHDPANILLLCDGHHKLLHGGLLTIAGRAPDALTFTRDGKRLVDARSPTEIETTDQLRAAATADRAASRAATKRNRFDDVVKIEHAKQALMGLGFKARAARAALDEACAHVRADADVAMLVTTVLSKQRAAREPSQPTTDDALRDDATKALVQSGYPRTIACSAVQAASAQLALSADEYGTLPATLGGGAVWQLQPAVPCNAATAAAATAAAAGTAAAAAAGTGISPKVRALSECPPPPWLAGLVLRSLGTIRADRTSTCDRACSRPAAERPAAHGLRAGAVVTASASLARTDDRPAATEAPGNWVSDRELWARTIEAGDANMFSSNRSLLTKSQFSSSTRYASSFR